MKGKQGSCGCLHVWSLGLALGVLWGVALCAFALFVMLVPGDYGANFINAMGSLYIGYHATWLGAFLGLIWGFIDAFFAGVIVAWLYNCFLGCCCKK
jgi:hypothetical protein